MDEQTCVYQYYDTSGRLLYVGITGRGLKRSHEHARKKDWWPLTTGCTIEHYQTRAEALDREAYLIAAYKPEYNTQGKQRSVTAFAKPPNAADLITNEQAQQMGKALETLYALIGQGEWKQAIQQWMQLPKKLKSRTGCIACRERSGSHGALCRPCYEMYVNGETRTVRRERYVRTFDTEQAASHSS